mgnify:CR=1 FL=1
MKKKSPHAQFCPVTSKEMRGYLVEKAAPDLLAALKAVRSWRLTVSDDRSKMPGALFHKIMNAMRKAEGKSR